MFILFFIYESLKLIRITKYKSFININQKINQFKPKKLMQGDQLLQKWKQAKQVCWKVVQIARDANIHSKASQKIARAQFMSVYEQITKRFSVVYNLCVTKQKEQKRVSMVYRQFKQILKEGLLSMCQNLNKERDICKLQLLRKIWASYTDGLKKLMHMFAYLNRPFHIKEGRIQQLQKTGLDIIFTTLFSEMSLTQYQAIYFKQLQKIRTTQKITNGPTLSSFVTILYTRHLKTGKNVKKQRTSYTDFYVKYSAHTRQFYQRTFKSLKELSPSEYFKEIHNLFELQLAVAQSCFGLMGEALFSREFSDQLMETYKPILLASPKGLKSILANKQIQTLRIITGMYRRLMKNIDGFKEQFQQFVYQQIREYMAQLRTQILVTKNKLNFCNFMEKLIRKNKEFIFILQQSFANFADFEHSYKSGVQKAFIDTPLQVPIEQILAIYADVKLKSSTIKQDQLSDEVKSIVIIFNYLQHKDLFLKKYTTKLAKRMINSNDPMSNHQTFINSLKLNCGMDYTKTLETLMSQLAVSRQEQKLVNQVLKQNEVRIMVSLKVFGEGSWPTQYVFELPDQYLPMQIQRAKKGIVQYQKRYAEKKTFRISFLQSKIRWIYYFQKQVDNPLQECYFDTNTLQGVLLQYIYRQRPRKVAFSTMQQYFQKIPKQTLLENINGLCSLPQKIITKQVFRQQNETLYEFNKLMKSKKRLLNYDVHSNELEERLFQQQDLTKDRQLIIDANISKLMKSKKIVQYDVLESQIMKMIKVFTPARRDIKASVDRLMGKQIIARDQKDFNTVRYTE